MADHPRDGPFGLYLKDRTLLPLGMRFGVEELA